MLCLLAAATSCSPSPDQAGDECEKDGDPCPKGLECSAGPDSDICQVPVGGVCKTADKNPYCAGGTQCVADGRGGATCGTPKGGACTVGADTCGGNLVCAEVETGEHKCFLPVSINGKVFDAKTTAAIAGAQVIALDAQATAITDVAITDATGNYSLEVETVRNAAGEPTPEFFKSSFTLRSSAATYLTFPGGLRTALPIDASGAKQSDTGWAISTPLTQIALVKVPADQQKRVSISGTVLADKDSAGVLVVAETDKESASAISDASGHYTIFNVPDGSYKVAGYAAGVQLKPAQAAVKGVDVKGVDLAKSTEALGSIDGSLQLVNPGDGKATSVVLVVASTFSDTFVRGDVPRGLRSPLTGPPNVSGSFTIKGVPKGDYVVLAAFENDHLVLDPDPNISGTQIVTVKMAAPGTAVTLGDSFKVTGALAVISPGAEDAEAVTDPPTFQWVDDSSEDYYSLVVYDSYGNKVWDQPNLPKVSGGNVSVKYGGPKLEKGLYYQFRATSWRDAGGMPGPISKTEDLLGVFYLK